MSDNKTDFLENAMLNHVLRGNTGGTAYTQPSAIYIALFTAAPTDVGGGTEVGSSGTGYARQQVTFAAASAGQTMNTNDIVFPKSTAAWGTVTHFALIDLATGGNMLYYGPLSASVAVDSANKKVEFEIGAITVTET
jgi:hypothetical protein